MRHRGWRKYQEERIVKKRLIELIRRCDFFNVIDANNNTIYNPKWNDFIGTTTHFMYKTYVTTKYDSRYKVKYGKKDKNRRNGGGIKKYNKYREKDKIEFRKLLEYELLEYECNVK